MINADHAEPLHLLGLEQNQLLVHSCKNMWSLGTALSQVPTTGKWSSERGHRHSYILASELQTSELFSHPYNLQEPKLLRLVNFAGPLKKF